MDKDLQKRIERVVKEVVDIVEYDDDWPAWFEEEKNHLEEVFPGYFKRIEHFGSTAVEGLCAKPIVDMLIEAESLEDVKKTVVPKLQEPVYDYFWRPLFDKYEPPFYAWFIKRGDEGQRTHHLHVVESDSPLWERLFFRDYLRLHPEVAAEYCRIKKAAAKQTEDRVAYTRAKTDFITKYTKIAKQELV